MADTKYRNIEDDEIKTFNTDPNSLTMYTTSATPVMAPWKGEVIDLPDLADGIFSQLIVGDGAVVVSDETPNVYTKIHAPISGMILNVSKFKQTFVIKNEFTKLLVHIGLETTKLNGEGINLDIKLGDIVEMGQEIGSIVNEVWKTHEIKRLIIVCVQNNQKIVSKNLYKNVNVSEEIFKVKR